MPFFLIPVSPYLSRAYFENLRLSSWVEERMPVRYPLLIWFKSLGNPPGESVDIIITGLAIGFGILAKGCFTDIDSGSREGIRIFAFGDACFRYKVGFRAILVLTFTAILELTFRLSKDFITRFLVALGYKVDVFLARTSVFYRSGFLGCLIFLFFCCFSKSALEIN